MNWFDRTRARIAAAIMPDGSSHQGRVMYAGRSSAGVYVDHDVALTFGALWAAVTILSQSMGVLGVHRYTRTRDGKKLRMDQAPTTRVLGRQANPYMTGQVLRETLTAHCCTYGNGYAEIQRDGAGRVLALWPLFPDRMFPQWIDGRLVYRYLLRSGEYVPFEPNDVLHIKGLGFDGVVGYDVVSYMVGSIGHGLAAEQYASSFFANGAHLSGALFTEKQLSPDAKTRLRSEFEQVYKGSRNAFRMAVFEEGMDWKQFSTTPEAAQMIQTRKFSVTDVARWYRIPPHMLADLEKASFSNIEQQALEFVMHALLPWVTRWEQECDVKLIPAAEQARGFVKFNVSTLLRGDQKSRFEAYEKGRQWGWLNANDIREFEDQDPIEGDAGTVYIVPLNFQRADEVGKQQEPPPAPEEPPEEDPDEEPQAPGMSARALVLHTAERMQSREEHGMRNQWGKEQFFARDTQRFFNRHAEHLLREFRPVLAVYAEHLGADHDDPRLDAAIKAVCDAWADRRFDAWMTGARHNQKPLIAEQAPQLADQLIQYVTEVFA